MAAVVARERQVDGSAGEHDGREGGLGAVEAVGPADSRVVPCGTSVLTIV